MVLLLLRVSLVDIVEVSWSEVRREIPGILILRLCPEGRSLMLGARGRCLPRARPPMTGSSYVAARQKYRRMSYTMMKSQGPKTKKANSSFATSQHLSQVSQHSIGWLTKSRTSHVSTVENCSGRIDSQPIVPKTCNA